MVCTLKVRRALAVSEDEMPYRLSITSQHAVGGAGGRLSDEVSYRHLPDLMRAISDLQLPGELLAAASHTTTELEHAEDRWLTVATDVQIPFQVLTAAGFDLEALASD